MLTSIYQLSVSFNPQEWVKTRIDVMLNGATGGKNSSLMSEYSTLLGEAILRSRARAAEQTAQIESDLTSKIKSEFISNMSHELRTPLSTIIGFSKLMREQQSRPLSDDVISEYAHLINDAASHLLLIINDILDISKLQSGRYNIDTQQIELRSILAKILLKSEKAAAAANVTLHEQFDDGQLAVCGDPEKLTQLFSNLIENAIKFTKPGGAISIETTKLADESSAIYIRNTGKGMTKREIEVALLPFGQVDGTRTRWREGTGLGLPIAKALAELHGGQLSINGIMGKGTEVIVTLPSPDLASAIRECDLLAGRPNNLEQSLL